MSTASLLFIYGNDEFAISRRLAEIQLRHDPDGMNTQRLEARSASQEDLHAAVNAMPFLSTVRLVFIAEPSARSSAPAARQAFLDFLLAAPPSTMVVLHELLEPGKDLEKHWLVQRANRGMFKSESHFLPRQTDMAGWIVNETKKQGGVMEPGAAAQLADMTGNDTRLAAQEITKLLTYVNLARPIRKADVEALGIDSAQGDVFALVDALGSGSGQAAQKVLHQLLRRQDAMALWGMVIRQFRLLLQAREVLDGGGNREQVARALALHPFVAGKITSQAGHFTLAGLERIYHQLLEIDEQAKTSQVPLDLALDMLVMQLTA